MTRADSVSTVRWLVLFSLLAVSINCETKMDERLKGKFIYCGPASPIMIDWLCRSIKHLETFGIKEGYIDPRRGYLPLTDKPSWKRSGPSAAGEIGPLDDDPTIEAIEDMSEEATMIKRGIHAHVAMSLCCRRMCDARVFCRGY